MGLLEIVIVPLRQWGYRQDHNLGGTTYNVGYGNVQNITLGGEFINEST